MTTGRRDDVPAPPLGPAPRLQQVRIDPEHTWEDRGKADKAAVADALRTLMGAAAAEPYVKHLEQVIDALDRK